MPLNPKIEPRDYYKSLPSIEHETGDIWTNIPFPSLKNNFFSRGIVITPACDLSQNKTETVTVLPIVTINEYLYSKCFFYVVWLEVKTLLTQIGINMQNRYINPGEEEIKIAIDTMRVEGKTKESDIKKIEEYHKYLLFIEGKKTEKPDLKKIFSEKGIKSIITDIVKNKYGNDIHFLPKDEHNKSGKILESHSLVLFRYPFSFPISILDIANSGNEQSWHFDMESYLPVYQLASIFERYPINVSALKDDFLSDLLSRYLAMYMRLGSRDFTKDTVSTFIRQIKEVI